MTQLIRTAMHKNTTRVCELTFNISGPPLVVMGDVCPAILIQSE